MWAIARPPPLHRILYRIIAAFRPLPPLFFPELYGADSPNNYPSTSSVYDMRTVRPSADFAWETSWYNGEQPTCPGHPNGAFSEIHNETQQVSVSVFEAVLPHAYR